MFGCLKWEHLIKEGFIDSVCGVLLLIRLKIISFAIW